MPTNPQQHIDELRLMRLMQLASSNLPVGGYTFSQGLEYAIDSGWVKNVLQVKQWIEEVVTTTLTYSDLPLIQRMYVCLDKRDVSGLEYWNQYALAIRETRELLLADTAMGDALLRLAKGMDIPIPDFQQSKYGVSYISMFSIVAHHMSLATRETCSAFAWTAIENQVLAATKLLPMGQTAAQLMLFELSARITDCTERATSVKDQSIGLSLPGLAVASAKHETQYSRLYRS